ncbi:MAG TPA: hypothetical protein VMI54_21570 [Polyangiaceae bacterium]|nr:hypothetical protein [Polyangiaceae bacterium]
MVTRPDIVPAPLRFAEESAPASSIEPMRELKPYPALRPHADDATVKYALMQGVSTVPPPRAQSTVPPASHTQRKTPTATSAPIRTPLPRPAERLATPLPHGAPRLTTPLPKGAEHLATPLPRTTERFSTPSVSFLSPPRPVPDLPPPSRRPAGRRQGPSTLTVGLILLVTTVVAAAAGASLGDRSVERATTRWFGGSPKPVAAPPAKAIPPAPVSMPTITAPLATAAGTQAVPRASAPPVSAALAPSERSPAVRFEDLPPAEQAPSAQAPSTPVRKRPNAPRRR